MDGIVVAVDALMARREVIPAVVEANAIAVEQIEIQAHIGTDAREELAKGLVILQKGVNHVDILCVVVHIGVARTHYHSPQGEAQFAIDRQQVVGMVADESKIVLRHAFSTEVEEHRNSRRGVHQCRDRFDIVKRLHGTASPKVPTVTFAVMETIKELGAAVNIDGRAVEITESAIEQHGFGLHMAASPFDGSAQTEVGTETTVGEGHGTVVVAIGHIQARIQVEPNRHLAFVDLPIKLVGFVVRVLAESLCRHHESDDEKNKFEFHLIGLCCDYGRQR